MKKEIRNQYEIKLEFNKNTENPSRLFYSFAEMIDSINELNIVLAKTIDTSVNSKIILEDIEKGSILAKLYDELVIYENGKIENVESKCKIEKYLESSRNATLNFISQDKSTVEDLNILKEELNDIATENKVVDTFNYGEPDILDLAKTINKISSSTQPLSEGEQFVIKSNNVETPNVVTKSTTHVNIELLEDSLTKEEFNQDYITYYKIKRPDFLGDSQWDFKYGNRTIKAKITDTEWLEKFKKGEVIVTPGDSLKVKVSQSNKYGANGYLISEKVEIIMVLEVRKNDEI